MLFRYFVSLSILVPDVFPMVRLRAYVVGKNATEVDGPSHHIISGVYAVNMTYQGVGFALITWLRWCLP